MVTMGSLRAAGRAAALLALLTAPTACGKGKDSKVAPTITLGVSMATFTSPYASAAIKEFKRYTRQEGHGLIILDAQQDIQREAFNIDNLIAKRVDAILVNATDSKGSRASLRKAARRGLSVICFNSSVDRPEELGVRAYSGPQYYEQAVSAARVAIRNVREGKVVMITGDPGYSAAIDREKGFTDTLAREGPGLEILDIQTANWMRENAQRVMSDFITQYGLEIDVVYSQDDNMTAGAVNALKAAGYTRESKPFVVSVGAMADGLRLVQEGWIDSTIMQSPKEEAQLAVDVAVRVMSGEQAEGFKNYFMNTPPVDRSNVEEVIAMGLWD
jgi:ribose transport system substrate-binding protein